MLISRFCYITLLVLLHAWRCVRRADILWGTLNLETLVPRKNIKLYFTVSCTIIHVCSPRVLT